MLPGRRPLSQSPFDRFGGFSACRLAARRRETPPTDGDRSAATRSGRVRPRSGYALTREEMRKSVKLVHRSLRRVPRATEYIRERERIQDSAPAGKPAPLLASYNRIVGAYGGWDAALIDCGYPPFRSVDIDRNGRLEHRHRSEPRNAISTEDLLDGIREAFAAKGRPFGMQTYQAYVRVRPHRPEFVPQQTLLKPRARRRRVGDGTRRPSREPRRCGTPRRRRTFRRSRGSWFLSS